MQLGDLVIERCLDLNKFRGRMGLEIEMEFPREIEAAAWSWIVKDKVRFNSAGWWVTSDGSISRRGFEFVIKRPTGSTSLCREIDALYELLRVNRCHPTPSKRCGVHVHLNVQDLTWYQVLDLLEWSLMLEPLFGLLYPDRLNNIFSLGGEAAYGHVRHLRAMREFIERNQYDQLMALIDTPSIKYSAVNISSLPKFGSLEFRTLPSRAGQEGIKKWVRTVYRLDQLARKGPPSYALFENLSLNGPTDFVESLLGVRHDIVRKHSHEEIEAALLKGMRLVQDLRI